MKKDFFVSLSYSRLRMLYNALGEVTGIVNSDNLTLATLSSLGMDVALGFELFSLDVFA